MRPARSCPAAPGIARQIDTSRLACVQRQPSGPARPAPKGRHPAGGAPVDAGDIHTTAPPTISGPARGLRSAAPGLDASARGASLESYGDLIAKACRPGRSRRGGCALGDPWSSTGSIRRRATGRGAGSPRPISTSAARAARARERPSGDSARAERGRGTGRAVSPSPLQPGHTRPRPRFPFAGSAPLQRHSDRAVSVVVGSRGFNAKHHSK